MDFALPLMVLITEMQRFPWLTRTQYINYISLSTVQSKGQFFLIKLLNSQEFFAISYFAKTVNSHSFNAKAFWHFNPYFAKRKSVNKKTLTKLWANAQIKGLKLCIFAKYASPQVIVIFVENLLRQSLVRCSIHLWTKALMDTCYRHLGRSRNFDNVTAE